MKSFIRPITIWAMLILGIQTVSEAQIVKFSLKTRIDCDSLFHVELRVRASTFSSPLSFNLGSSSVLLNYDANSFEFKNYVPVEFDKTTSTRAATANWDNQKWTSNQTNGIFNVVLFKQEGGTNDYLLDTLADVHIGNLYLKVKPNAPTTSSKLAINRNYAEFLSSDNTTKLALEQLTSLTLIPQTLTAISPTIVITGGTSVCPSKTTSLNASGASTYVWSNGATTATINNIGAGTYTVSATSSAGCTVTKTATVTASAAPVVTIAGATSVCNGQTTTLTASGGVTYRWSSNSATTPTITVAGGNYIVTATNAAGCTATASVAVTTNPLPNVAISGSLNVCTGLTTVLTASGGATYTWSNAATTPSVTVGAGTYTVTATSTAGCKAAKTVTVISNPFPIATIAGASRVCTGLKTDLTASGGATYKWSTGSNSAIINVGAGTYTVSVISAARCTTAKSATITADPLPVPVIAGATSVCTGATTTLTASGGATYLWSNGATTPSVNVGTGVYTVTATSTAGCTAVSRPFTITTSIATVNVSGTTTVCGTATTGLFAYGATSYKWSTGATTFNVTVGGGTYTVTATNSIGCTATKTVTVTSNPVPVVNIAGATDICTGATTVLTASGGATYNWSNGATTAAITVGSGGYMVTTTSAEGCKASKYISVTTRPITANITGVTTVCGTATTTLTASGGATYAWSNGATTAAVVVSGGTYTVTATNTYGCTSTKTVTVISNPVPVADITGTTSICAGQTTVLTASGIGTYRWNNGAITPSVTVGAGTYTVTVTSAAGCKGTKSVTVISNPLPIATIAGTSTICVGATTALTASGGATYLWSNGATTPSVNVGAGTYTVTATSTAGCKAASRLFTVTNSVITATITGTLTVCGTAKTTLRAAGGLKYKWNLGDTTPAIIASAGTYTVTATNALGCTSTKTATVISNPLPIVNIEGKTNVCTTQTTVLTASGGATYRWNNAAITASITVGAGNYTVTATSAAACSASKSFSISNRTTPVGTACNDGNPNTINDVIQANGCTCQGVPNTSPNLSAVAAMSSFNNKETKLVRANNLDKLANSNTVADVRIFPNPASDYIDVDLADYEGQSVTLLLYNRLGQLVLNQQIETATTLPVHFQLGKQSSGQYLLRVTAEGQKDVVKKFVILH